LKRLYPFKRLAISTGLGVLIVYFLNRALTATSPNHALVVAVVSWPLCIGMVLLFEWLVPKLAPIAAKAWAKRPFRREDDKELKRAEESIRGVTAYIDGNPMLTMKDLSGLLDHLNGTKQVVLQAKDHHNERLTLIEKHLELLDAAEDKALEKIHFINQHTRPKTKSEEKP